MKIDLTYGASYEFIINTKTDETFYCELADAPLQVAVSYAQAIFDDETAIHGALVSQVLIVDSNTGEILAKCTPDTDNKDCDFDNPNYDPDWGYNEDMGFDPYLGCYSDDC